jgi:hypothetical protein
LRLVHLEAGDPFHTAYRRQHWPELFNPAVLGDARFSPLTIRGAAVPTVYGADTQTVALLETCFHDVHVAVPRLISERLDLAPRGLVSLSTPVRVPLVDLRDAALADLGLHRSQLIATTPEHYACTRQWAEVLHDHEVAGVAPAGLLWQSRVAELAQQDSLLFDDLLRLASNVFVFFGDRVPTAPPRVAAGRAALRRPHDRRRSATRRAHRRATRRRHHLTRVGQGVTAFG